MRAAIDGLVDNVAGLGDRERLRLDHEISAVD